MKIYSIVDVKAKAPASVFTAPSDEIAIRMFNDLITVPEDTVFSLHHEDFDLYAVGVLENADSSSGLYHFLSAGDNCNALCILHGSELSRHLLMKMREERLSFLHKLQEVSNDVK